MDAIQDVLRDIPAPEADHDHRAPARPPMDERLWPADLKALLDNKNGVPMQIEGVPGACPNCGGVGMMTVYMIQRGPFQSPGGGKVKWLEGPGLAPGWYTGEMHYSPCPCCQEDRWREYLRANCGLEGKDLSISLEGFKAGGPYFQKEAALTVARGLLAKNQYPGGFVTFWGKPGVGKSHLLKSLVNGFRLLGVYSRYINAADLINEIRDRFGDGAGGGRVEEAIRHYRKIRVLCIDELDKIYSFSGWTLQTLHRLLDTRYESAGLLTALAMNKAPEDLPGELEYLASRISGGVALDVGGDDMRPGLSARVWKGIANE